MNMRRVKENLCKYNYIFPRVQSTMKVFRKAGFNDKIIRMCDPAFTICHERNGIDIVDIPTCETIGINISNTLSKVDYVKNVHQVIHYILQHTSMDVFLIPHVFPIKQDGAIMGRLYQTIYYKSDLQYLKEIYASYHGVSRVRLVNANYNSKQFKYIISKCKIIIASRTHVSIAAYSSLIPTIVIGYSIKAIGLALDIFGTTDHFVIMREQLSYDDKCLLRSFKYMLDHYDSIKAHMKDVILQYSQQSILAAKFLVNQYR